MRCPVCIGVTTSQSYKISLINHGISSGDVMVMIMMNGNDYDETSKLVA